MHERVLNKVKTAIEGLKTELATGRYVPDYATYQNRIGEIKGLLHIEKICLELVSEDEQEYLE